MRNNIDLLYARQPDGFMCVLISRKLTWKMRGGIKKANKVELAGTVGPLTKHAEKPLHADSNLVKSAITPYVQTITHGFISRQTEEA